LKNNLSGKPLNRGLTDTEDDMTREQQKALSTEPKVYHGMTQTELSEAFELVKNKANWKLPIDAVLHKTGDQAVDIERLVHVIAGVIFFTASTPSVTDLGIEGWKIKADGYYNTMGV
jgi:hypothetical protein